MVALVAGGAQFAHSFYLLLFDGRVHLKNHRRSAFLLFKTVKADYNCLASFDSLLILISGVLNFALDETVFDGAQGATHFVDACDIFFGSALDFAS